MFWNIAIFVCAGFPYMFECAIPGGVSPVSITDPTIVEFSNFAISKLSSSSGDKKELGELLSATSQVVAGRLVTLKYRVKGTKDEECTVQIIEQAWLNRTEVTQSTCGHDISKRSVTSEKKNVSNLNMFHEYIVKYEKEYKTKAEYKKRYHIFKANLKKIDMMNEMEQGTAKYGVNEFADMSLKEFKTRLGLVKPETLPNLPMAKIPQIELPESYDWRHYNAVTPVKNQGSCGSCWAFSVTGNIEGQWAVQRGELLSLSEQEIVDCDKTDSGCGGGYMTTAYDAIVRLGGLETEKDYPYEGEDETCNLDLSEVEVRIEGGVNITSNETQMAQWLVSNGPISVGLNANVMQFYLGGVSHPFKFLCNPNDIDHGVLIVGYGVHTSAILKKTLPYWIVKNSWGKNWGELGYYRLYRGDGSCGINQMASSAVL